jgi:hypothetical protein
MNRTPLSIVISNHCTLKSFLKNINWTFREQFRWCWMSLREMDENFASNICNPLSLSNEQTNEQRNVQSLGLTLSWEFSIKLGWGNDNVISSSSYTTKNNTWGFKISFSMNL